MKSERYTVKLAKCQRYYISLFCKLVNESRWGREGQESSKSCHRLFANAPYDHLFPYWNRRTKDDPIRKIEASFEHMNRPLLVVQRSGINGPCPYMLSRGYKSAKCTWLTLFAIFWPTQKKSRISTNQWLLANLDNSLVCVTVIKWLET